MRFLSPALCAILAVELLAGCSGTSSQVTPSSSGTSAESAQTKGHSHHPIKPQWAFPANFFDNKSGTGPRFREVLASLTRPNTSPPKRGIYVNEFYDDKVMATKTQTRLTTRPSARYTG